MRRLDRGGPADLGILRALAARGDQPVIAEALASLLGVPAARVPVHSQTP